MKLGVNVYGYVFAESGTGEHTRLLVSAIREAGIEYSVIPFETTLSRQESDFDDFGSRKAEFNVNIIGVNADQMEVFVEHFGRSALDGRYNIGLWAWEVEDFPDWMAQSALYLDEIWANSTFSAKAIAEKVDIPVHPFPLPIRTPNPPARSRYDLGLPEGFLFLFCFDLDSVFARKNPLAVVEAFKLAFPIPAGAYLLVKSINGGRHPDEVSLLEDAVTGRDDITYRDGYLTPDDQDALIAACDAYVSLHRSEGFGLTMAEAMALGRPVIATGYSGNLDFMNQANSFLVSSNPVKVGAGNPPYSPGALWAEPDVGMAAELIRQLVDSPQQARARIEKGRRDISGFHSPQARSAFVADRVRLISRQQDEAGGSG